MYDNIVKAMRELKSLFKSSEPNISHQDTMTGETIMNHTEEILTKETMTDIDTTKKTENTDTIKENNHMVAEEGACLEKEEKDQNPIIAKDSDLSPRNHMKETLEREMEEEMNGEEEIKATKPNLKGDTQIHHQMR